MEIDARTRATRPRAAARLSETAPTSRAHRCSRLRRERVRDQFLPAERASCTPRRRVEHRTRVACAHAREPCDFARPSVVEQPRDRTTDDRDRDNARFIGARDSEESTRGWRVVAMHATHELRRFTKSHRNDLDHGEPPSASARKTGPVQRGLQPGSPQKSATTFASPTSGPASALSSKHDCTHCASHVISCGPMHSTRERSRGGPHETKSSASTTASTPAEILNAARRSPRSRDSLARSRSMCARRLR